RRIFDKNGTVADAAVATMFCACVVMAHLCGIGGGFFAIHYDRKRSALKVINARETAPLAVNETLFLDNDSQFVGIRSIAVPGQLRGFDALRLQAGSALPWADLLDEAIELAEKGVPVSGSMATELRRRRTHVVASPELSNLYVSNNTGDLLKEDELLVNPALARTLRTVAQNGSDVFYTGVVAQDLVRDVEAAGGGLITLADLSNYTAQTEDPMAVKLNQDWVAWSPGPPSSGLVVAFVTAVLNTFRDKRHLEDDEKTAHRMVEAFKFAFAHRTGLGDAPLTRENVSKLVGDLQSPAVAHETASKIRERPQPHSESYGLKYGMAEDHGSAQVAVLGPSGDAVLVVGSLNWNFGSLVLSGSTGVLLNNAMAAFSLPGAEDAYDQYPASPSNALGPGYRPMASLAPTAVTDYGGRLVLLAGATGGPPAITGLAQVLVRTLWMKHTLKEAIDAGRLHHQLLPDVLHGESIVD
ncbi:unnamed protein product, partial [Ixodes hexagonus]